MATPLRKSADRGRLRCGIVLRVHEDAREIIRDGKPISVRYAAPFPSPRTERVSPGHLVAVATAPDGSRAVVGRWYDAVVLGEENGLIRLWEPAHGEVLAQPRRTQPLQPGTRAYASAVELDEVERFCNEHDLWNALT